MFCEIWSLCSRGMDYSLIFPCQKLCLCTIGYLCRSQVKLIRKCWTRGWSGLPLLINHFIQDFDKDELIRPATKYSECYLPIVLHVIYFPGSSNQISVSPIVKLYSLRNYCHTCSIVLTFIRICDLYTLFILIATFSLNNVMQKVRVMLQYLVPNPFVYLTLKYA